MKSKFVSIFVLLVLGFSVSSCEEQVKAQITRLDSQLSPMNVPSPSGPPAENPNLDTSEFPPIGAPPTSLPLPKDLSADIGENEAVQRALKIAEGRFGANNPQVVSAKLTTYKEAMQLGPEPLEVLEQDPRSNMLVRVVEMKGAFKIRSMPAHAKTPPTFTKALIIVRAPDGLILRSALSLE